MIMVIFWCSICTYDRNSTYQISIASSPTSNRSKGKRCLFNGPRTKLAYGRWQCAGHLACEESAATAMLHAESCQAATFGVQECLGARHVACLSSWIRTKTASLLGFSLEDKFSAYCDVISDVPFSEIDVCSLQCHRPTVDRAWRQGHSPRK